MSRLKLYRPEAPSSRGEDAQPGQSAILTFNAHSPGLARNRRNDVIGRARCLHQNSRCPVCRHPVTQPIELNDGLKSRSNLPIPGTATLVGFRCQRCESEWPV